MGEKELFGFAPEEIELIRKTVGKEAVNDDEFRRFLYRASKMGLNPLDGTIHLLTRNRRNEFGEWEKTNVIIVGIDGFRIVADRSGKLAGIKREAIYNDKGQLVRAVAEVYRKDWEHPAREVIPYREYCQHRDGKPIGLWASMPETMLKKCAEAAALRMAFASELAGVYIPEEVIRDEDVPDENRAPKSKKASNKETAESKPSPKTPKEPPEEAPGKTGKETSKEVPDKEPPAKTSSEAPEEAPKNETGKFEGELIILEPPKTLEHPTFGQYQEILAFDPAAEKTYTLVGKNFSALKPKDIVHITGEVKDDRIKPASLTRLTRAKSGEKETETPNDARGNAGVLTVKLTSQPATGRKTFDGQFEDILWARAQRGDEKYIIVARGAAKDILARAKVNDTISVRGEVVNETNGTFVYAAEIKAQVAA